VDHECGVKGKDEINVLADPLAGMYGQYLLPSADLVGYGLYVAVIHVGYAGKTYPVGYGQDVLHLLGIELLGYRTSQDYGVPTAFAQRPASLRTAFPEVDERCGTEGCGCGIESTYVLPQLRCVQSR